MTEVRAPIPWDEIDEGIRGPLRVLAEAGIDTISSCQGGGYGRGHGYIRPTIIFNGEMDAPAIAEEALAKAGCVIFQFLRRYDPVGQWLYWQVEFVDGAACGR